jgi:hypothetical protein
MVGQFSWYTLNFYVIYAVVFKHLLRYLSTAHSIAQRFFGVLLRILILNGIELPKPTKKKMINNKIIVML